MATEVLPGLVTLPNGVADHAGEEPELPADSATPHCNGDVPDLANAGGEVEGGEVPSVPGPLAEQKGLLGVAPPVPPPQGEIPAFGDVALVAQPLVAAEKVPQRLDFFLVKVPRPDLTVENNRIKVIQMRISEKKEKHNFIGTALRLKQAARSEAQAALRGARDRARACSAEVRKKFDEAKPLQDMLRRLNEGRKDARAQGRGLEATSEAELNDLISSKEHRMLHDSITLNEEKQLMKEIKQLEASRPKVREMEALNVTVFESLGQRDAIQAQLKPLLAEAEFLKVERDAAQEICKTFEQEAQVCEQAVQELMAERAAAMQEQDAVYDELRSVRAEAYKKEEEFRQFRRDYAQVQELAATKNITELEKFCHEQRERIHLKLNSDPAYRKAYVAANLFSTIRRFGTADTRRLGVDEDPATLIDPNSVKPGQQQLEPLEAQKGAPKGEKPAGKPREDPAKGLASASKAAAAAEKQTSGEGGAPKGTGRASAKGAGKGDGETPASAASTAAAATEASAAPLKDEGEVEKEKERRREEAALKAKEAELRKKKQAERAQQRADSKAAKEAEEAAKKREKEKERKARKKAASVAEKEAAAATAAEQGEDEGVEQQNGEGHEDGSSVPVEKLRSKKGKGGAAQELTENLTKRQRKRQAASRKGEHEPGADQMQRTRSKGVGGSGPFLYVAAAAAVVALLALLFFGGKLLYPSSNPVFED